MNTVTVFDISAGVIAKGQRAWTKIKATAEETRILWLEIGNALAVGRHQNPSNKLYGAWVKAYGFNDLGETTRKNALWLSSNWGLLGRDGLIEIPKEFTHPTNIRAWAREQEYEAALPEDAPEVTIVATPKFATHRDAVKFIKVDQRAETDDEGSAIAKRHRAAIAKSKDTFRPSFATKMSDGNSNIPTRESPRVPPRFPVVDQGGNPQVTCGGLVAVLPGG